MVTCWRRESATWLTMELPGSRGHPPNGTTIDRGLCWASSACNDRDFSRALWRSCCTPVDPTPEPTTTPGAPPPASDDPGCSSHLRRRRDGWWVSAAEKPVVNGDEWARWDAGSWSVIGALWSAETHAHMCHELIHYWECTVTFVCKHWWELVITNWSQSSLYLNHKKPSYR